MRLLLLLVLFLFRYVADAHKNHSSDSFSLSLSRLYTSDHFMAYIYIAIFAPTDDAFDKLPVGLVRYLSSSQSNIDTLLTPILQYHIAQESFASAGGGDDAEP